MVYFTRTYLKSFVIDLRKPDRKNNEKFVILVDNKLQKIPVFPLFFKEKAWKKGKLVHEVPNKLWRSQNEILNPTGSTMYMKDRKKSNTAL